MPFADPTSVYLENLARRRAQAEMYGQQFRDASEGISKGLGQWDSAMRLQKADAAKAEAVKAAAEQQAFENEQTVEGLRIRKAQEQREADEAARIAAARPGEEARAAEDRAFTLKKRETDTAQAARKAAIERIQSLPAQPEFGDGVDVKAIIEQIGAEGGLSSDEALGAYRQAQTIRADAEDKAKRVPMPKVPGGAPGAAAPTKQTAQQVNRHQAIESARGNLAQAKRAFEEYQAETANSFLPSEGLGENLRSIPGLRAFNPPSRTRYRSYAAAIGAALFPILGRSDAPSDPETKNLIDMLINEPDAPADVTRERMRVLEEMLSRESGAPVSSQPTNRSSAPDPDAFLSGDF